MLISTTMLKKQRKDKGWSQDVLSKTSGLSLRTIQRIENQGKASAESILAISSALEITPTQLHSANDEINVTWTRRMIMKGFLAVIFIVGAVFLMMFMNISEMSHFFDSAVLVYFIFCMVGLTIMSFGSDGLAKSIFGLKYIFASEIVGGKPAHYLCFVYSKQIAFSYASALAFLVIGLIAVIREAHYSNSLDLASLVGTTAIMIGFLYAIILSEFILRPLKNKLESADMYTE
ncbi:MAG: hypothetical protein Alis3KO_39080 [Aliiglaciecola sp.]